MTDLETLHPYFTRKELACKATGKLQLAPGFASSLLTLRKRFEKPMIVTSCCRSSWHNAAVGGSPRSLHICDKPYHKTGGTCAIDIDCRDVVTRAELAGLALRLGWSVGVNQNFIHLDRRSDYLPLEQALFLY